MRKLLFFLFLLTGVAYPQDRYLVSPNDDFIPLRKGESGSAIMNARMKKFANSTSSLATCSNQATFGFTESLFPPSVNHVARHKDVMGQWFVAKATGTIDTIYWDVLSTIGAKDSLVYIRVHRSILGPTAGPGIRPGPYNPPCQNWGYWVNTNDLDQGVAAFPEDATDTTWHSTYNGAAVSFPPFSNSLWGFTGYPVVDHPGLNHVAMMDIAVPLSVTVGDQFFVSVLERALGYFCSKLLDSSRDGIESLSKRVLGQISYNEQLTRAVTALVHPVRRPADRHFETLKAAIGSGNRMSRTAQMLGQVLGYALGRKLYGAYLETRISRRDLQALFRDPLDSPNRPLERYRELTERLS